MLNVGIILGSTRPNRNGEAVAKWVFEQTKSRTDARYELVDIKDYDLPLLDEPIPPSQGKYSQPHTKRWAEKIASLDAFVFVTPEYNYAPPPALVNALNYLSREWNYAPVGFVSYGGISGGLRSVQVAKQIVTTLKMMPIPEGVPMPMVFQNLDENGKLKPLDIYRTSAATMLDELLRWTEALKSLRADRKTKMKAAA